jgi:hypothetical protein
MSRQWYPPTRRVIRQALCSLTRDATACIAARRPDGMRFFTSRCIVPSGLSVRRHQEKGDDWPGRRSVTSTVLSSSLRAARDTMLPPSPSFATTPRPLRGSSSLCRRWGVATVVLEWREIYDWDGRIAHGAMARSRACRVSRVMGSSLTRSFRGGRT